MGPKDVHFTTFGAKTETEFSRPEMQSVWWLGGAKK